MPLCYVNQSKCVKICITFPKSVFVKPHVEEIIATEETPDPNEILIVEEGDDPEGSWQAAKEGDVKSTVAEVILHPTGSLDRQEEKSVETNT